MRTWLHHRAPFIGLIVGTSVVLSACVLPEVPAPTLVATLGPTDFSENPGDVRLLSLNIAHGSGRALHPVLVDIWRFRPNLEVAASFLRRERPDVVALQEVDGRSPYTGDFDHLQYLGRRGRFASGVLGIHFMLEFFGPKLVAGTGLLAQAPMRDVESHPFDTGNGDLQGFVVARILLPTEPPLEVDVVSLHLHPTSDEGREAQLQQLASRLRQRSRPQIVLGDFNCIWEGDSRCVGAFAKATGLTPYAPADTMPSYSVSEPKFRLDWILLPPELEFVAYRHLDDHVSDHRPVLATVRRRLAPS